MADTASISFERQGPVGLLKLNRPEKKNAQTLEMWHELRLLGKQLLNHPGDLAVVVVSGEGGCFSSGIDTSILTSGALLSGSVIGHEVQEAFSWLRDGAFISIAAIERFAIGAGMELALWCDMRLASEGTFLSLPEVEYGIIPDLGGCTLLPEICGYARAIELIATSRRIEAIEAWQIGLVNEVVPGERFAQRVVELTQLLTKRSVTALRGAKKAARMSLPDINRSLETSLESIGACLREIRKP